MFYKVLNIFIIILTFFSKNSFKRPLLITKTSQIWLLTHWGVWNITFITSYGWSLDVTPYVVTIETFLIVNWEKVKTKYIDVHFLFFALWIFKESLSLNLLKGKKNSNIYLLYIWLQRIIRAGFLVIFDLWATEADLQQYYNTGKSSYSNSARFL